MMLRVSLRHVSSFIVCVLTSSCTIYRFVQFSYSEGEKALHGLDDGVFFVRKVNEKEYEICLRYALYCYSTST